MTNLVHFNIFGRLGRTTMRAVALITYCLAILIASSGFARGQIYTPLDDPLAGVDPGTEPGVSGTYTTGINGANVVGYYRDQTGNAHGFLFNGSTYATLDDPLGAGGTYPRAISGTNVVGYYVDANGNSNAFIYNGKTFTTLVDPANPTAQMIATGIDGANVVGYENSAGGFLYNGQSFTSVEAAGSTRPYAISAGTIVGEYDLSGGQIGGAYGFVYKDGTYTTVGAPAHLVGGGGINNDFIPIGISENQLLGIDNVVYDGSSFYTIDVTQATGSPYYQQTFVTGIDGNTVVGYYTDAIPLGIAFGGETSTSVHSFITTVPEPSPRLLLSLAWILVLASSRRLRIPSLR